MLYFIIWMIFQYNIQIVLEKFKYLNGNMSGKTMHKYMGTKNALKLIYRENHAIK